MTRSPSAAPGQWPPPPPSPAGVHAGVSPIHTLRMEEALALLRQGGSPRLAPRLESEIRGALDSLEPYVVLEVLKQPAARGAHELQQARREALQSLLRLLEDPSGTQQAPGAQGPAESPVNDSFLRVALQRLTTLEASEPATRCFRLSWQPLNLDDIPCPQICSLMDWGRVVRDPLSYPQSSWHFRGLPVQLARAHMAAGYLYRRPALLQKAQQLLRFGGAAAAESPAERIVCCVLLGQVEEAADLLAAAERRAASGGASTSGGAGLAPLESGLGLQYGGGAKGFSLATVPGTAHSDLMVFVRRHSPDPADLLPGLCALAEQFMAQECCPAFRDLEDHPPGALLPRSLDAFFDDPRVVAYLSAQVGSLPRPLARVMEAAESAAHALEQVAWRLSAPLRGRRGRVPGAHPDSAARIGVTVCVPRPGSAACLALPNTEASSPPSSSMSRQYAPGCQGWPGLLRPGHRVPPAGCCVPDGRQGLGRILGAGLRGVGTGGSRSGQGGQAGGPRRRGIRCSGSLSHLLHTAVAARDNSGGGGGGEPACPCPCPGAGPCARCWWGCGGPCCRARADQPRRGLLSGLSLAADKGISHGAPPRHLPASRGAGRANAWPLGHQGAGGRVLGGLLALLIARPEGDLGRQGLRGRQGQGRRPAGRELCGGCC